ncbi:MAG TPA: CBS domain-containing protein [Caldimonas sp.]
MSLARICRCELVTIDASATLREVASLMHAQQVGALVVTVETEGRREAVGVLTDRDLVIEVLARDLDPADVKAGQLARHPLAAVPATAGLADAVAVMRETGVRCLLVAEPAGQVAGFVSADDLLEALAQEMGGFAVALRGGGAREGAERRSTPPPQPVFLPHGTPRMQPSIAAG